MVMFCPLPKSLAPSPPPKDLAPTESREKPMEVTTTAETMGEMALRHQVAVSPRRTSNRPPTRTAPMTAP